LPPSKREFEGIKVDGKNRRAFCPPLVREAQVYQNDFLKKLVCSVLGIVAFLWFWGFFLYATGFLLNLYVPKSVDSDPVNPLGFALANNSFLILLFGIQHSVMARKSFKKIMKKVMPDYFERSFYVLLSNLVLSAIFVFWQPITIPMWSITGLIPKLLTYMIFALGCVILIYSLLINDHFEFIGLRQIYLHLSKKEYTPVAFKMPSIYKHIRHPMYLGTLIVFWATPEMTLGHLLLALGMTLYTLIGVRFEEQDLSALYGDEYNRYMQTVGMLFPKMK
jgi:methanethiol S-methyltransferase